MQLINIREHDTEGEETIFNNLRGRRFFAVSVIENKDVKSYHHHRTIGLSDEEVNFGCDLLKLEILNDE